jgi:hypothetical protein
MLEAGPLRPSNEVLDGDSDLSVVGVGSGTGAARELAGSVSQIEAKRAVHAKSQGKRNSHPD